MPKNCMKLTSGGKGNLGKFIERDPNVCAAGKPSAQAQETVALALQHYLLKDAADALLSDAIIPEPKPRPLPPLRKPIPQDTRNSGPFNQVADLINPPTKSKFKCLVDDFMDTAYTSYWKKPLGRVRDPVPMLPEGFDATGTTFGKPTEYSCDLYEVITPKIPLPDKTPYSEGPGVQVNRNYCAPAFSKDFTYGYRTFVDKRGTYGRCCITDDRTILGTADRAIISSVQSNFLDATQPRISKVLAPNNNIKDVPHGYTFGRLKAPDNLPECLTFCEINPGVAFFRKCLNHLNTLRKGFSRRFLPSFFHKFYMNLKYYDKERTGWLPKDFVYEYCATKLIRFDHSLIEPLLSMWEAFDGQRIKYKTFVLVLNYRIPSPEIPKIHDLPEDCLDFRTTYTEMVKPGQEVDNGLRAGLPSGRYFDRPYPIIPERLSKADTICLPQESDVRCCISPSVLTLLFVSHRDLFEKREPHTVRRVFEAAGEKFTDEKFNAVWEAAKKLHSQGWVCYETFRQTLENHPELYEIKEEEIDLNA
ncbi:EF-hand domain-containing family member B isoform X1 [Trichoplusia ni]|uniref:EF-hand domain-containing family member B isoform X1 n=1 Tax=Trichoplusia ni TaxID=7111 RepID=A0A7E5VMU9_TRINI|nr:EF-hand domain-containing family member B isoform X1 [Trichoplusia ni]